jgi:hypothetical protein
MSTMVNYGQHDFWLTRLFPRTKSRVNQGVGVFIPALDFLFLFSKPSLYNLADI